MADALTRFRMLLAVVGCWASAGCYAPQILNVSASVSDWRSSQAQAPASAAVTSTTWTVEALVERAITANPDILAWAARVDAAAASVGATGRFNDLEMRVSRAKLTDFEQGDPTFDVALRGRPPRPGEIASREDAARMRSTEVAARRDAAKHALRARVRRQC